MAQWNWRVAQWALPLFCRGKDLEIRLNRGEAAEVAVGDMIRFNNQVAFRVRLIRHYESFEMMLARERTRRIAPGFSRGEILEGLRELYPDRGTLEVLVFELAPVETRP